MQISVVIVTHNEEANLARTLASVKAIASEIIVVDSGSTDRTAEIAKSQGAKVFVEEWKGYAAQKNSAIEKATGDWILSLDADEEVEVPLAEAIIATLESIERVKQLSRQQDAHHFMVQNASAEIGKYLDGNANPKLSGFSLSRKNHFLGRWIKHGGFWPDPKLRLFRRRAGKFEDRSVHETVKIEGETAHINQGALVHHSYPTLSEYIEHMNRYSSLGAEMVVANGGQKFPVLNIVFRPLFTFLYNYIFRGGFLDGREGLLLHIYHSIYVSWKYAKAWELSR
ncbi:MAG TPA: glycosyltransferase family 2 protein [Terriglobales bacterium]|nr:glycosyltransferase family 2 protein [Terriglobales bacterium]